MKKTINYKDGSKYVGEFKEGKFDGQGTMTLADGSTISGAWKDCNFIK